MLPFSLRISRKMLRRWSLQQRCGAIQVTCHRDLFGSILPRKSFKKRRPQDQFSECTLIQEYRHANTSTEICGCAFSIMLLTLTVVFVRHMDTHGCSSTSVCVCVSVCTYLSKFGYSCCRSSQIRSTPLLAPSITLATGS